MILTVTANPAIDRMYFVDAFDTDRVHRVENHKVIAGGKGVNVTKVLDTLGSEVVATGFLGGASGQMIEDSLKERCVKTSFAKIAGETRTTISIADDTGQTFELVEKGPSVSSEELEDFNSTFDALMNDCEVVVFSGSLANNLPPTFYRMCINKAKEHGARTILDTSGEALKEGLKAGPDLIKPNVAELGKLVGRSLTSENTIKNAAYEALSMGAKAVAVSLGSEGMIYLDDDFSRRVTVPKINVVNPVGSGDSVTAGFAHAFARKSLLDETLLLANACGVSNAKNESIGYIDINDMERIKDKITIS